MLNRRRLLMMAGAAALAYATPNVALAEVPVAAKLVGYNIVDCMEDLCNGDVQVDDVGVVFIGPYVLAEDYAEWRDEVALMMPRRAGIQYGYRDELARAEQLLDMLQAQGKLVPWARKDHSAPLSSHWGRPQGDGWYKPVRLDPLMAAELEAANLLKPYKGWRV